jgi:hypothetical protein
MEGADPRLEEEREDKPLRTQSPRPIMNQDYILGEGCQCSARCSCECGCDVDWTPKEVYELRATISDMEIRHAATMLHTQSIVDEANELRKQRDRLLEEREQWRLSSVCRIMKRDLEKARIENDWLGERLDKMEIDKNKAEAERNLWKAEAERWREQTGENFQVTAWKQLIEQERNRMRGL